MGVANGLANVLYITAIQQRFPRHLLGRIMGALALTINAVEAMPRGGNLWIRTAVAPAGDTVHIEVRDDGVGIPPDLLPQIFEPFKSTKEGGNSAGLGLAVSRSIVERHRGRMDVASEVGRGTTFTIVLPIGDAVAPAPTELAATLR